MLKRIESNAYVVDLSDEYNIYNTLNESDLIAYKTSIIMSCESFNLSFPTSWE